MTALRTPDARFRDLPDYDFAPHYTEVGDGLRMHHVEAGPADGAPVLMLHGEPTWSYLYRHMVPVFAAAGHRAVAPDLVGFGRSDKPGAVADYSYQSHMDWLTEWLVALDLRDITLVCQDWGSLLGLRLATEQPDRFARIVVANGFLPTADRPSPLAFKAWRAFALHVPVLPVGRIVAAGTKRRLSKGRARRLRRAVPERGAQGRGPGLPGAGAHVARRPRGARQPGGLGAAGGVGEAVPHALRQARPDPGQGRRPAPASTSPAPPASRTRGCAAATSSRRTPATRSPGARWPGWPRPGLRRQRGHVTDRWTYWATDISPA